MLEVYAGLYKNLTPQQQQAVTELTAQRYIEDYYYLDEWLQAEKNLISGTESFRQKYIEVVNEITEAFRHYDENTYISAIFSINPFGEPIALSAARNVHGKRDDISITASIGNINSTIPTHRLLQSFKYPTFNNFYPEQISEADVCEWSRRVTINKYQVRKFLSEGLLTDKEAEHFCKHCMNHLLVVDYKCSLSRKKACIFNMRPFLLHMFTSKGIRFIPLFKEGVEPTTYALNESKTVLAPLFLKWENELNQISQGITETRSIKEAICILAQQFAADNKSLRGWKDCNIPLPFLLLPDDHYKSLIDNIALELYQEKALYTLNIDNNVYDGIYNSEEVFNTEKVA